MEKNIIFLRRLSRFFSRMGWVLGLDKCNRKIKYFKSIRVDYFRVILFWVDTPVSIAVVRAGEFRSKHVFLEIPPTFQFWFVQIFLEHEFNNAIYISILI